jgi:hypothetical protein
MNWKIIKNLDLFGLDSALGQKPETPSETRPKVAQPARLPLNPGWPAGPQAVAQRASCDHSRPSTINDVE